MSLFTVVQVNDVNQLKVNDIIAPYSYVDDHGGKFCRIVKVNTKTINVVRYDYTNQRDIGIMEKITKAKFYVVKGIKSIIPSIVEQPPNA
jgi:hypothetical protein